MIVALTVIHLLHYMYFPAHEVWYHGAVWSNVFVLAPLAVLGTIGYWIHKLITRDVEEFDAKAAHDEHSKHLRAILDALDPDVESDSELDLIADRVDDETPSGLGVLLRELRAAHGTEDDPPA